MKNKIIMTMSAIALTVALAAGISYAWFTDQAKANPKSVGAGYLRISLTGVSDDADNIFPAEEGKTIDYTITNPSKREVVVQFKAGALTAYVMPDEYQDSEGYIIKDKRNIMENLTNNQKMNIKEETSEFIRVDNVPITHVTSALVGNWTFSSLKSKYLGKDASGNQYILLSEDDSAIGKFRVSLTAEAGNRYQYALFNLGEATAIATQNNATAIASAFNVLDINNLIK